MGAHALNSQYLGLIGLEVRTDKALAEQQQVHDVFLNLLFEFLAILQTLVFLW